MTEQIYRARTLKRDRRTNAKIDQLDAQILEVLREDHPQSVRHVFYRMTNPRLPEPVEKLPERALAIAKVEEQSAREYFETMASMRASA